MARQSLWHCIGDAFSMVLDYLSTSDLLALCLVDKGSRTFAEARLYSDVEISWEEGKDPPIAQFMVSIVARPDLATHVRSLRLLGRCYPPLKGRKPEGPIPFLCVADLNFDRCLQAVKASGLNFTSEWKTQLLKGRADAIVSLCLSQLHQIRTLALGYNFTRETELIGMLLRATVCATCHSDLSKFEHLHEVTYHSFQEAHTFNKVEYGRVTRDLIPLFYLPKVRRLTASLDNPVMLEWPQASPHAASISYLDLKFIRESSLRGLLTATPALKVLRWQWYYDSDSRHETHTRVLDLQGIWYSLGPVCETIEELDITVDTLDGYDGYERPFLEVTGTSTGLRSFKHLKMLKVPLALLVGFNQVDAPPLTEVMPIGLQRVFIADTLRDYDCFDPQSSGNLLRQNVWTGQQEFAAYQLWLETEECHPDLHQMEIEIDENAFWTEVQWDLSLQEKLIEIGHSHGVKVSFCEAL